MTEDIRAKMIAELKALISKGNAHVTFEEAVAELPKNLRTQIPGMLPYSIWQLVEHIRITQKDILDFCLNKNYKELKWPDEYWTGYVSVVENEVWEQSLATIKADRNQFFELLEDNQYDLLSPFEWGSGQNLMREAILIGDHTAYHTAEIVIIRRLLKAWK